MNDTTYRPTWAEIDLGAVKRNLAGIRKRVPRGVSIMAVVKANAYGHGLCPVSSSLVAEGVDYLGVATVDEALTLRSAGFSVPVLVLGSVLAQEAEAAVKNDITLTLCTEKLLEELSRIALATGKRPRVHIKVDTGMGRIGVWHEKALDLIQRTWQCREIELEGIYTHFSSAARDEMFTRTQISDFNRLLEQVDREDIELKYRHAANSIAIMDWKASHLNMVRPGILLYGVYPKRSFSREIHLDPVMELKTRIVYLKDTPPGRSISYGRTYITQSPTRIATIPIGYADGYGRILSNKAKALVSGKPVRIVGMVTMDQTLLDVGRIDDLSVGDEVVLIGRQGDVEIRIEKVAKLAGTIPYEILAAITDRVPRIYLEK
ncbi:MAG: alanine racemase [Candidatus Omnitrophica bacterium]|nr:alanine racemase [Candidatus Omnitrophota bacterium]